MLHFSDSRRRGRFQVCAEEFCESYFKCSYQCHLQEKPSSSNSRTFIATFSKPTLLTPAPPAVVRVNLEVVYEGGGCKVSRFKVDGSAHWLDSETPFNELWFDRVIRRKLACQQIVSLDDAFTETRMPQ